MIEPTSLRPDYQSGPVSSGTLKLKEMLAVLMIAVMALGPLAVTAYQNPYTGKVTAQPNVPTS